MPNLSILARYLPTYGFSKCVPISGDEEVGLSLDMAEELLGSANAQPLPSVAQVRLQLSTRHAEYSLPTNPGPIIVPTGGLVCEPRAGMFR